VKITAIEATKYCLKCRGRGKLPVIVSSPGMGITVKTRAVVCPACGSPSKRDREDLARHKMVGRFLKSRGELTMGELIFCGLFTAVFVAVIITGVLLGW